ncbi:MAG: hypothetical protein IJW40_00305 [Clostridia bacterium]|nr:hypothetical protein [Clostridia bacterium]
MKNFFRERSYDAVKLLVMQCAISMFGLVLTLACGMIDNDTLRTGCSVFAILFYLFLVYTGIWDLGAKDAVSVEYGHREYQPLTGLWIALLANSLNFLFAIGILLGNVLPDIELFSNIGGGSKLCSLLMQGMYTGLLAIRVGGANLNTYVFSYFLIPLPAIITSTAAYYFGLKNKRFTRLFELKTGKKSNKDNKNRK